MKKTVTCLVLALLLIVLVAVPAVAKTTPAGETVGNVLFYITNSNGEEILVSQIPVSEMEADMKPAPNIASLGSVAAPTAVMTDYGDNFFVYLDCETEGATILYNHNFISPSYIPTSPYGGTPVIVPKSAFRSGTVTLTARAVKEGCTDAGVVTLSLTSSGTEQNPEIGGADYSDVAEGIWYYDAVHYVMDKGLFDLTGRDTFSPTSPMTRGMLVTALYRLEESPPVTVFADFVDVTRGTPLSAAVSWCWTAGIVTGYPDGSFGPDRSISRQDIAVMLYRYATYKGHSTSAAGDLSRFADADRISPYASDAMVWANGMEIITGSGGRISPRSTATRAQVATMLMSYGNK